MKKCKDCNIDKPFEDYYRHKEKKDGYSSVCKDCCKDYAKKNYSKKITNIDFKENELKRGREKYRRLYKGTLRKQVDKKAYLLKYPEKRKAKTMSGSLKRPFEGAEKHHWSYNEEHYKDVIWLTKYEHMKGHRFIIYDQERKMYRRYDNNVLLDTKESHENFIKDCIKNQED